jgi:hypothetical protein
MTTFSLSMTVRATYVTEGSSESKKVSISKDATVQDFVVAVNAVHPEFA